MRNRLSQVLRWTSLVCVTLAMTIGAGIQRGQAQPECDTTVSPGELIQHSINVASPGAIVCLGSGVFPEALEIRKSITLRGAGQERTYLEMPSSLGTAIVNIEADGEIQVQIEELTVTSTLSVPTVGMNISGKSRVTLKDVRVCDVSQGVVTNGLAQVQLRDSLVCRNLIALLAKGVSQTNLLNSPLTSNNFGVDAKESSQVVVTNSAVQYNRIGFLVSDSATVVLHTAQVSNNGVSGLVLIESSTVQMQDSTISDNGFLRECRVEFCNGVELNGRAQLIVADSIVVSNTDWGIGSALIQCGYAEDAFTGSVVFKGHNIIEGNNKLGKHDGAGNPGNHIFKNGASGQVCVP